MKPFRAILLLTIFWAPFAAAQDPEAWVRQTDLETGLIYDMPVPGTGTSTYIAPLPVSQIGGRFELFARGTAWDTSIYLLDTELVYAYSPAASMLLETEDPYVRGDPATGNYVRRTRSDRPFNLNIQIAGLVEGSTVLAENAVFLGVEATNYDLESYSPVGQTAYDLHEYNLGNGSMSLGPLYHELSTGTLTTACGEQTYTFVRYASDSVPDTIIAQPKLEIWPVATAQIAEITEGLVFTDRIPSIPLTWKHLYPDSRTYAQIYAGPAVLGTTGTIIAGTERRYGLHYNPDQVEEPTNVPQDVSISIQDLSNYAAADGIYTLEVITETPFFSRQPERLLSVTFEVDRVISSRGQLSSTEKPVDVPIAPPPGDPCCTEPPTEPPTGS
jgi:hypothetical protein